ncbi:MAG: benzoyl-CoA 2,3-epoxidase subunit BoxB, partial [Myxococcales bacterium]|nr:benzoyl-CoA 2,3-epoxidase subunit BoxB [Myxococcales bacterium]
VSLDLFGGEISSNAASYFASSLKGRAKEEKYEDHVVLTGSLGMDVPVVEGGKLKELRREDVPLRNAMNEVLREEYIADSQRGLDKWNKLIEKAGVSFRITLPSRRFHRASGIYAGLHFDPAGNPLDKETWEARKYEWIPSPADEAHVKSLMSKPIYDPKGMANWIAAPARGIKGQPVDFEYVKH